MVQGLKNRLVDQYNSETKQYLWLLDLLQCDLVELGLFNKWYRTI